MGGTRTKSLTGKEKKALDKEGRKILKAIVDYVEKSSTIRNMLKAKPKRKARRAR